MIYYVAIILVKVYIKSNKIKDKPTEALNKIFITLSIFYRKNIFIKFYPFRKS